jgi:hypothetical protein
MDEVLRVDEFVLVSASPAPFGSPMTWRLVLFAAERFGDPLTVTFAYVADTLDACRDVALTAHQLPALAEGRHAVELECPPPADCHVTAEHVMDKTLVTAVVTCGGYELCRVAAPLRIFHVTGSDGGVPGGLMREALPTDGKGRTSESAKDVDWGLEEAHQHSGATDGELFFL